MADEMAYEKAASMVCATVELMVYFEADVMADLCSGLSEIGMVVCWVFVEVFVKAGKRESLKVAKTVAC